MEGAETLKTVGLYFSPSAHSQITVRQNDVNYIHTRLLNWRFYFVVTYG
jgi:hypothetical protein